MGNECVDTARLFELEESKGGWLYPIPAIYPACAVHANARRIGNHPSFLQVCSDYIVSWRYELPILLIVLVVLQLRGDAGYMTAEGI